MKHINTSRFGKLLIPLLLVFALAQTSNAQTTYKLGGKPVMTLYGTSTLHDWTMTAHTFTGNAQITFAEENQMNYIGALTVILPVRNLKSEHDGMNDNAYESLKADDYKDIIFKLTSSKITSTGTNKYQITAGGSLTIAGVTRAVNITAAGQVNADGSIGFSGTVPIKLSEYKIERPSFFLGTMKVGDAMTLNFSVLFVR
jgi:polyisoprenoid-binding protein YceI